MPLDFELLKTILGFVSIIGGTVSGVAALLVEYKDKETGKITKWGRYALIGVGASFLIGASNLWLDYTQKKNESRETANKQREASEQTLRIVTDISRTLNPLKDVRASFWATYRFDQPELAKYRERLDEGVHNLLPSMKVKDGRYIKDGIYGSSDDRLLQDSDRSRPLVNCTETRPNNVIRGRPRRKRGQLCTSL